eukprot:5094595-Pyramimonas_sp.AAC.1
MLRSARRQIWPRRLAVPGPSGCTLKREGCYTYSNLGARGVELGHTKRHKRKGARKETHPPSNVQERGGLSTGREDEVSQCGQLLVHRIDPALK